LQNLREEVAMDVDEDEDGTQRPKKVQDFGIEVDFEALDDEEREVCMARHLVYSKQRLIS
jgi:structural maintenance of chromosome 1